MALHLARLWPLALLLGGCGSVVPDHEGGTDVPSEHATDHGVEADADTALPDGTDPSCGDGIRHTGEECDDGNGTDDDGCTSSCRFSCHEALDCDDRNQCTADACEPGGTGRVCSFAPRTGEPCDDGNICTDGETCDADGACVGGANVCACSPEVPCPDDGNACNGRLVCRDYVCVLEEGSVVVCPEDVAGDCVHSVCNPSTGFCEDVPDAHGTACPDDLFCDGDEFCNGSGACIDGPAPCRIGGCVVGCDESADRCALAAEGTVCRAADGPCDVAEACNGTSTACPADGHAPTTSICRPAAGPCDLPEACTGSGSDCPVDAFRPEGSVCEIGPVAGVCRGGVCVAGSPETCNGIDDDGDGQIDEGVSCLDYNSRPVCPDDTGPWDGECGTPGTCQECTCSVSLTWVSCTGDCTSCPY
ncbi:MAG: hypothetical protein JXB32_24660 [Deltaproteobacteria bacterium]|nr:hypothetical protein [Deltaproteobacteria bacterium]